MSVTQAVEDRLAKATPESFIWSRDFEYTRTAVDTAMCRAVRKFPEVTRVSKGLYWKGRATRFGVTRPDPLTLALELAGDGAGPTGWSALAALGLTSQVPATPEVAAVAKKPTVGPAHYCVRSNRKRSELSPMEVALLEVLRTGVLARAEADDPPAVLRRLLRSGVVREKALLHVAKSEPSHVREELKALAA